MLGKVTESIKILLSKAQKRCANLLIPILFPVFGAHISDADFQYPDLILKDSCSLMDYLVHKKGVSRPFFGSYNCHL